MITGCTAAGPLHGSGLSCGLLFDRGGSASRRAVSILSGSSAVEAWSVGRPSHSGSPGHASRFSFGMNDE
jgi:hypothetical protein